MKRLLLIVTLLPTLAFASPISDSICSQIVRETGDGQLKTETPSFSKDYSAIVNTVMNAEGEVLFSVQDKIVSLVQTEKSLWILTRGHLLEMSFTGELMGEYSIGTKRNHTMTQNESLLLIARGSGGLLAFDMNKKEVLWSNSGSLGDGWAVAVTSQGKTGYAATQSADQGAFTGIVSFDVMTGKVLKRSPYHYAYGVIGIDVRASMYKGNILLNNQGWIHMITPQQFNSGKMIKPRWVAHQVPRNGDVNPHYMMLEGDFILNGNELTGCGKYSAMDNGSITMKGKMFQVKLP